MNRATRIRGELHATAENKQFGMKVHLRKRQITSKGSSKPRYTLYLDIYYSRRNRKREFLGLYLEPNDTKQTRLDKIRLAENYKAKRLLELANEELGLPSKEKMERDFIAYFKEQMEKEKVIPKLHG